MSIGPPPRTAITTRSVGAAAQSGGSCRAPSGVSQERSEALAKLLAAAAQPGSDRRQGNALALGDLAVREAVVDAQHQHPAVLGLHLEERLRHRREHLRLENLRFGIARPRPTPDPGLPPRPLP